MATPSSYVLGQSAQEHERLMFQSRILRPYTERYFRAAGLREGMRVLDIGSGMGDVAMLAGDIVGPGGQVLGIDFDGSALEFATRRAVQHGCSRWVSFEETPISDFSSSEPFDALVGRYILLYQADAADTLRRLLQFVKPGGIVAFHELDFSRSRTSDPPCPLWDRTYPLVSESFQKSGFPSDFGSRIGHAFARAGLPFPTISADIVAGGGRGSYLYPWLAYTLTTLAPRFPALGIETDVVIDETLTARLEDAAVATQSQILGPIQFGAWTRKPV